MSQITNECPYCSNIMRVTRMTCPSCDVAVNASFPELRLGCLPTEHQRFIEMFVLAAGNLKEIAKQTGVSYPTIRSRLNKVIDALRDEISKSGPVRGNVLDPVLSLEDSNKVKPAIVAESANRLIKSI